MGLETFAVLLALASLATQFLRYSGISEDAFGWITILDVDMELTLPSIYTVLLLFAITLLLGLISILKWKESDKFRWHWAALMAVFLYMAFDEGSSIHELVVMPIRGLVGDYLPGFLLFNWVIVAMIIILLAAILYLKFFFALPVKTKKWAVLSAVTYVSGLVVMEMIGGQYADLYGIKNLTYNILVTIEESLEMSGLVLGIYTFLDYLENNYRNVHIHF